VKAPAPVPADFCYPAGTISADAALAFMLERARTPQASALETREVTLEDALGGVLAAAVGSPIDVPGYDNSQMDGYALRAADAGTAGAVLPVSQRVPAGVHPAPLAAESVARIFTGAPIPEGADTVVMQERCDVVDGGVRIPGGLERGDNVRPRGNDIVAGQRVLEAGERLRAPQIGLAASLGLCTLTLYRQLRVALFSSGDELRFPGEPLAPGQIYNSNRYGLRALLERVGAEVVDLGRVVDTRDATVAALQRAAAEADVIVSSGGVSVGEEDHVRDALEAVGRLELWRVAVKPGKPLAYGRVGGADFIGLPGNPVSALVTFCLFVRPFLLRRMGARRLKPPAWPVEADFEWPRPRQRREYARARLVAAGEGVPRATLYPKQGSDVLSSCAWADGLVEIPEGVTVAPGDTVRYLDFDALFA
jgi:molybdopterin molybdotransferase